jgi:hypothetical protein
MTDHSAEAVGAAAFVMLGPILNELERINPGAKSRIVDQAKASVVQSIHTQPPGGQGGAILAVLDAIRLS